MKTNKDILKKSFVNNSYAWIDTPFIKAENGPERHKGDYNIL